MKCHICGGELKAVITDMPLKTGPKRIVILKDLPVLQCESCGEYVLEDDVMSRVEDMLAQKESRYGD